MANDLPITVEDQITMMKKYVTFRKRKRMREFLHYAGYFRASRYGKYLLSFSNVFAKKPTQDNLFDLYQFDFELKKIMYEACAQAEIQIKSAISNAISLKTGTAVFYLDPNCYTPTRSERGLRQNMLKYPELKEYRSGGRRYEKQIPCWAAFSYFEFGTIENIYMYLRSDLRKEVLVYGYLRKRYGKKITNQMDTWLNGIRTLRNICAHHSKIVGMQEAIVLAETEDDGDILLNGEDFFSRLYALKKVMNSNDSENMKIKLKKLIGKTKIDIYQLNILPVDWEDKFDRIKYL